MSMYVSKEKEWDIYYERKGEELNITSSYGGGHRGLCKRDLHF